MARQQYQERSFSGTQTHPEHETKLDESSVIPLYHQLAEELRNNIESGEWPPNFLIPSESELCRMYGVSRGTVREAVAQIVHEGLLYRKQGKGTYVSEMKNSQQLNQFYSVAQNLEGKGLKPFSRIMEMVKISPPSGVRKFLRLNKGEKVYKIVGVKIADGKPVTMETSYIVEKLLPDLERRRTAEMENIPLYDIIRENYKLKIGGVEETFEPVFIDEYEADELNSRPGSVGLLVRRITYADNGVPFEYRTILLPREHCKYQVKLICTMGLLDINL